MDGHNNAKYVIAILSPNCKTMATVSYVPCSYHGYHLDEDIIVPVHTCTVYNLMCDFVLLFISYKFVKGLLAITFFLLVISS